MADIIKAIRGMNDVLPSNIHAWQFLEDVFIKCLNSYGYKEIRFPFLESTSLFKRTIGEVTDIVEKEMYSFTDLNGESISLRPEGTAGCVRACVEHGILYNQQQKLWYKGPMFRHERPQKGRYRQFNQFGVEVFGVPGVGSDLELILICDRLWDELCVKDSLTLQVNTLGSLEERIIYRDILINYFKANIEKLDVDSLNRLEKNPLRILDSKNPSMQDLIAKAPKLLDSIGDESKQYFQDLCDGLKSLNIKYVINPCLVRGLDYYSHTVFEWVSDKLGSQSTICAGGRFDKLIEQLSGSQTSAIGFAIGIERVLLLMQECQKIVNPKLTDIYIIVDSMPGLIKAFKIAELIRRQTKLEVIVNTGLEKFKSQFKKADKSGAHIALILGADELDSKTISVKDLRSTEGQKVVLQQELLAYITAFFEGE